MALNSIVAKKYEACNHIQREKPSDHVDEATTANFKNEADVLPLFESKIYSHCRKLHYSLKTNQFLKCRWQVYMDKLAERRQEPFKFPNENDNHFYKYSTKFEPSQTVASRTHFRKTLRHGPGVDIYGQIPTPIERHVRVTHLSKKRFVPDT